MENNICQWVAHEDGTYSFLWGRIGWERALFKAHIDGVPYSSDHNYRTEGQALVSDKTRETIHICERGETWIALRRDITNTTDQPIALSHIQDWTCAGPLALGAEASDAYLYHAEGIFEWGRYKVYLRDMAAPPARTVLGDPVSPHFGATGWTPYAGIVFGCDGSPSALIEGALSQKCFYRYWTPYPGAHVEANMGMFGIAAKVLPPGQTLEGEIIYLEIAPQIDWGDPFGGYNQVLRRYAPPHALAIGHGRDLIWGTWNDGPYNMVHDFIVRRNADYLREHLPSVTWIQIDEGYANLSDRELARDPANPDTGFGRVRLAHYFYAERENQGICARKFPEGMKATADYIRERGFRPAIWTGLNVTRHARIVQEHPEWFQDNVQSGELSPLNPDVSIPQCMAFIKEGFRRLVRDWGYEGIKLDFWTYPFVANQRSFPTPFRYTRGNQTGLELMHELLSYIRGLLGDGYLQLGCDISCGNPFIGQYADNFRYGIDVGDGKWENIVLAAKWMAFHATAAHRLGYLANSDSIGVLAKLGPVASRTWANFCFVSGTMLEIGGDFAKATPDVDHDYLRQGRPSLLEAQFGCPPAILADLRKLTARIENGTRIYFPDRSYLDGQMPPAVWIRCDTEGRAAHVGIFNWSAEAARIDIPREPIAALGRLHDFYTGAAYALPADGRISLAAKASLLLEICRE